MSELNDIVAVGLDLKPDTLLTAYENGVFPWPTPGMPMLWYCPSHRGILEFRNLKIQRRLKQYLKKAPWTYTMNRAFKEVIQKCSERKAPGGVQESTWITDEMKNAYISLHELGHAHSIEVWNGKDLVGGLYGVDCAGYFAGESMFFREANASKAALLYAIAKQVSAGRRWMDTQMVSPHVEVMGGHEITRAAFLAKLEETKKREKVRLTYPFVKGAEAETFAQFRSVIEKRILSASTGI